MLAIGYVERVLHGVQHQGLQSDRGLSCDHGIDCVD